jgi:ABC-type branched-subunit amino acid transport system ATPase component
MLRVEKAYKSFGGISAVNGCSINVEKGSIVGLIGPNGAGKSTLFDLITGFQKLDAGKIYFLKKRIDGLGPHNIAKIGLVRTFQIPKPLSKMTVLENMLFSFKDLRHENLFNAIFRAKEIKHIERINSEKVFGMLEFLGLSELRDEYAGNLSTGQMKLLELARALMLEPELLLLDEPLAGINPSLSEGLLLHIKELQRGGMTFLIVEHNMDVIMRISEMIYVLDNGSVLALGTPKEIRDDERVLEAYLGK